MRPPHDRARPYVRVVACEREAAVRAEPRFRRAQPATPRRSCSCPAGSGSRFEGLRDVADVVEVSAGDGDALDLPAAMTALRERGIFSVLCEGGPRLAASLLAAGVVDRVYWAIAPRFLSGANAVPVLSGRNLGGIAIRVDRVERADGDVIVSGIPNGAEADASV